MENESRYENIEPQDWSWNEILVLGRAYCFTKVKELGDLYVQEVLSFLEPAIGGDNPSSALTWAKTLGMAEDLPGSAEEFVSYYLGTRPEPRYAPQAFQIHASRLLGNAWPGGELYFSWKGEYHSMGLRKVSNLPLSLLAMSGLVDATSSETTCGTRLDGYCTLTRHGAGRVRLSLELPDLEGGERECGFDLPPAWVIPLREFSLALASVIENELGNVADQAVVYEWLTLAHQRIHSTCLTPV